MIHFCRSFFLIGGLCLSLQVGADEAATNPNEAPLANSATPLTNEKVKNLEPASAEPAAKVIVETPPESAEANPSVPIVFREKPVLRLYYQRDLEKSDQQKRAQQASKALEKALTAPDPLEPEARLVDVLLVQDKSLDVRIRGYRVLELTERDRRAAGFSSLQDFQEQVLVELNAFVSDEFKRVKIQRMALQFFLSVFFALLGFVVFRKVGGFFNQADQIIEERRDTFKPFVFLNESLISGPTLGALLAVLLVLARILSYFIVVLTTLVAISGQFRSSRDIMGNFLSQMANQLLKGLQNLLEGIPGLLLATILLFSLYLGIKFLNLFLRSLSMGRIQWSLIQGQRIPVIRFWGGALLAAIFLPLIAASLFGRFQSPFETIILVLASVLALATLPIFLSIAAGSFILWNGGLKLGQWVKVGDLQGEITDLSLFKMTLVPDAGGRIHIPMLKLVFQSFIETKNAPDKLYSLSLIRKQSAEDTLARLQSLFAQENLSVEVTLKGASADAWRFQLRWNHQDSPLSAHRLPQVLGRAVDQEIFTLAGEGLQETPL